MRCDSGKDSFHHLSRTIPRISHRKVTVFTAVREHQINDIGFAAHINTDVKWVHVITFFLCWIWVFNRHGKAQDHGASTPSHIRIQSEMDWCEPYCQMAVHRLRQTANRFEANFRVRGTDYSRSNHFWFNRRKENYYLIDTKDNYIMGLTKPIE